MSSASPEKPSTYTQSPTPGLSDVELEVAVLRSVVDTRPVGQHKHILMIQLQAELQRRTGVWLPSEELWDKIGDIFDIPKLESLVDDPSLPNSPEALSPLPSRARQYRRESASLSPLSAPSRSPSPVKSPSKSAKCINSGHFRNTFTLPYLRLGEEEWKPHLYDPVQAAKEAAGPARRRSRSVASSSTRPATDDGAILGEAEPDLSDNEYEWWSETIQDRAKGDEDAVKDDTAFFQAGLLDQIEQGDKAREREEEEKAKTAKKVGRPSKASKAAAAAAARGESSELSDQDDGEEDVPRAGRGRRAAANANNKRKRDSAAKDDSEEEKETKDTKTRRKKR